MLFLSRLSKSLAVHDTDYDYDRVVQALAFQAVLVPYSALTSKPESAVVRTIAMREDQTLEQLHEALRLTFGWADPHLYSFWLTGRSVGEQRFASR